MFKRFINALEQIAANLTQIYGELNRIRLILGEKSERGQYIEQFDRENNHYAPFFGNLTGPEDYKLNVKREVK